MTIKKSIVINATAERVFDALTTSAEIVRYYPLEKVTSSWEVGRELRMEGTAEGNKFEDVGMIRRLDRPSCFKYSYWNENHGTENLPENHLTIRYEISKTDAGCRLDVTQTNLPSKSYRDVMEPAWDFLLESLKKYVESGP